MSEIGEAIGTAAEGAALAAAVEGEAGKSAPREGKGHFHETACLNCGTELVGSHCHACGQAAHLHRTLGAFLHDLSHGVLHLEGRTWRTLPMLAWKPGELTRRYIDGERARYVSPMAIFLFSVFLMFAVFQLVGLSAPSDFDPNPAALASEGPEQAQKQLDGLREARAGLAKDNPAAPILDSQIAAMEKELAAEEARETGEQVVLAEGVDGGKITGRYSGIGFFDRGVDKWRKNPGLMLYKLQANAYKFSWLLIPLSLPFVWLIFAWKRRFGFYDHAVFVTYSISFMTLLFIVLTLAAEVGISNGGLMAFGALVPVYHIYRQLRGAYQLSRFSALWRTLVLGWVIVVVLVLFAAILMLLGLAA